jgi:2-phospho-L-lactate guanylyltransferase
MAQGSHAADRAAVVVPVKAFSKAKARLAEVLPPVERAQLARSMATTVVRAAGSLPVVVVCDDDEVRAWAETLGVEVLWTPGLGLNGAVAAGVEHLAAQGVARAIVAHADLPLATDLTWVGTHGHGVTIVPDRHGDGTNVISLPTSAGFEFAYGAGSCAAHEAEAARLALMVQVVPDERLGWDVDRPEDLELPSLAPEGAPCP